MNEFLNYISYRIEFFSLPTFKDQYVVYLANEFSGIQYRERTLDQAEMGLVDVDKIAMDLDLPLSNIMNHKNYVFDGIIIDRLPSIVYVNPYYIYIHIPINIGDKISETLESDVKCIFNKDILKDVVQIQNVSCIVNHSLKITPKDLYKWEVLDKEAFPQIYPNDINTGKYSDSHKTDNGIEQILIREIIKGRDIDTDHISLYVSITSISTHNTSLNKNFKENYQELFNLALNEAARCFK